LFGTVRPTEFDPVKHEQDRRCVLPDWLKPCCFGARVQKGDTVAMLSELADPSAHLVAIERGI